MSNDRHATDPQQSSRPMVGRKKKRQYRRLLLRQWREYRGMTQEQLADAAGLTQGMISQLENAQSDFTGETLDKLAHSLKCEPFDLLARDPQDPDSPWPIWETLDPAQKKRAIRLLKALPD